MPPTLAGNNISAIFTTTLATPAPSASQPQSFCLSCGFDFGYSAMGMSNSGFGLLMVLLVGLVCCTLCVLAAYCMFWREPEESDVEYSSVADGEDNNETASHASRSKRSSHVSHTSSRRDC